MIKIYTRLGDPECMKAKTFLENNGIKYENITISTLDGMTVPRIEFGDIILESFFPSQLIKLLHLNERE